LDETLYQDSNWIKSLFFKKTWEKTVMNSQDK